MAFGLDVTDLIYTDENFVDVGTLEDYEVDLDIAGRMDFELRVNEFIMYPHCLWYVDGTEYGGFIDGFTTDSKNYSVCYKGRSFRGILASKILYSGNLENTIALNGRIDNIINRFLEEYTLDYLFVCDIPEVDETGETSTSVNEYEIEPGYSIYDVILLLGDLTGYTFEFIYYNVDHKVHIFPILPNDYTDYLTYCRDNSISFTISQNAVTTNHIICSGIDEKGKRRTIHLFADDGGEIQNYLKDGIDIPTKDSDYILDTSKQVITGIDEVTEFIESGISVDSNYELVTSNTTPSDWDKKYSTKYFEKVSTPNYSDEYIRTVSKSKPHIIKLPVWLYDTDYVIRQAEKKIKRTRTVNEKGTKVKKKNFWLYNPETVAIIDFDESYINESLVCGGVETTVPVSQRVIMPYSGSMSNFKIIYKGVVLDEDIDYVVEQKKRSKQIGFSSIFKGQKVSLYKVIDREVSYQNPQATTTESYKLTTTKPNGWNSVYSYYYTRTWDENDLDWSYSQASNTTKTNLKKLVRIKSAKAPKGWKLNYSQYYYKFQTGTGIDLRQYSAESKNKYTKLKKKPSDWDKNYSSYYRVRYEKKEIEYTKNGQPKKNKVKKDYAKKVEGSKKVYRSIPPVKKKETKNGKTVTKKVAPKFVKNKYYRLDSKSYPPKYKSNNCYLPAVDVIAPTWKKNTYYSKTTSTVKPSYKPNFYYKIVNDHYRSLVSEGLKRFSEIEPYDSQNISISEYVLNIGDYVGGYDDMTGIDITQQVTNIIVKINKGVITTEYEIGGVQ